MAGTYYETNTIIGRACYLKGSGMTNTFIQPTTAYGVGTNRIFQVNNSVKFSDLTLQYGALTNSQGSAIYSPLVAQVVLRNVNISSNQIVGVGGLAGGGAVYNSAATSSLTMSNCIIQNNLTSTGGVAAINFACSTGFVSIVQCVFSGNQSASGYSAALYANALQVTISDSTFVGNTNSGTGANTSGGLFSAIAGGVTLLQRCTFAYNYSGGVGGGLTLGNAATLINCTVYGNTALTANGGGGVNFINGYTTGMVYNCTIVSNTAPTAGAGIANSTATSYIGLFSSIVASNSATDLGGANPVYIYDGGKNLVGLNSGDTNNFPASVGITTNSHGSYVNVASALGPIVAPANNGGLTMTCAITNGLAIDHGTNILNLVTDQRGVGYIRTRGAGTDIGAYESGTPTSLSYSTNRFSELVPPNTGGIDNSNPLIITLTGDTFAGSNNEDFVAAGLVLSLIHI